MATDSTIFADATLGNPSGTYMGLLQSAIAVYGEKERLLRFADSCAGADTMLSHIATDQDLLHIYYNADVTGYLDLFDSLRGSAYLDTAIAAVPTLTTPRALGATLLRDMGTGSGIDEAVVEAVGTTYEVTTTGYSFGLAQHDIYGSSRLGVKNYWPGQIGASWGFGHWAVPDTIRLWARKPWYSLEYQDAIVDTARDLYGKMHVQPYVTQHTTGQKQYELTDHLSNVLATISDARNVADTTTPHAISSYVPVVQSAYDYYPFGMYMPSRHTEDTNTHCAYISTDAVVTVGDSTWEQWDAGDPWPMALGLANISTSASGGILLSTFNAADGLKYRMQTSPDTLVEVDLKVAGATADYTITVIDSATGATLATDNAATAVARVIPLPITSTGVGTIFVIITPVLSGGGTLVVDGHWVVNYHSEVQPVVTQVCSGEKYPYGYNGQMKDNEWCGVGNHYDFGARLQDSRTGRWLSLDPLSAKYSNLSPYNFVGNSPIAFKDYDGKDYGITVNHDNHTIVVTANYYTTSQIAYKQANNGADDLNSFKANVSVDGVNYTVTFEAKVIPPTEANNTAFDPSMVAHLNANNDAQGNSYNGTRSNPKDADGIVGGSTRGNDITMREMDNTKPGEMQNTKNGGDDPKMVAHEMLHTMGADDHPGGRMEYVGGGQDMRDIATMDVYQVLDYAIKNDGKVTEGSRTNASPQKVTITQTGKGNIKEAKKVQVTSVEKKATTPTK